MLGAAATGAALPSFPALPKENRSLYCLLATSLVFIFFILSFSSPPSSPSPSLSRSYSTLISSSRLLSPPPPSLAYFIAGSDGDSDRLLRLTSAVYHPKNLYLLHLDLAAPQDQRDRLALAVGSVPAFRSHRNVHVVGRANNANPRGASALAAVLHGAAILMRLGSGWDWFVTLDASDYPLVTQDDLLHILSFLPRDLNFVHHESHIGWRESHRLKPIVIDPGLYLSSKSDIFYATQKRDLPNAYKLFTGSPSVILSRKFVEFCILGTDNMPRSLLMYYTNTPSHTNYFPTVLCNSKQFNKTAVNHNLHYISWDVPPEQEPHALTLTEFENVTRSGFAFGTRFLRDDPILDRIDQEVLRRGPGRIVSGGWCLGEGSSDPCTVWGDVNVLRPGSGAKRLEKTILQLISNGTYHSQKCSWS